MEAIGIIASACAGVGIMAATVLVALMVCAELDRRNQERLKEEVGEVLLSIAKAFSFLDKELENDCQRIG